MRQYNLLKSVLREVGVQGRELADRLGVSKDTVSRWNTNKRQPSLKELYNIADALEVDIYDLLPQNKKGKGRWGIKEKLPETAVIDSSPFPYNRIDHFVRKKKKKGRELAEVMGVLPESASKWRHNHAQPSIPKLFRIADFLEVSPCELLNCPPTLPQKEEEGEGI